MVGRADDSRGIDRAKSPLGQRFDKQLYPASGEIDYPRGKLTSYENVRIHKRCLILVHDILENNRFLLVALKIKLANLHLIV